jgi:hypothetical protein
MNILLGIGSGLGNAILQLPLACFLRDKLGHKVDIALRKVPPGTKEVFETLYRFRVKSVDECPKIKNESYDLFYMTRSYTGNDKINFNLDADMVIKCNEYFGVEEYELYDETEFEFKIFSDFLGFKYDNDDLTIPIVNSACKSSRNIAILSSFKKTMPASKRSLNIKDWNYLIDSLKLRGWNPISIGIPTEYINGCINCTSNEFETIVKNLLNCYAFIATDMGLVFLARCLGLNGLVFLGPTSVKKTKGALLRNRIRVIESDSALNCPFFPCWQQRNTLQAKFKCKKKCLNDITKKELETIYHDLDNIYD